MDEEISQQSFHPRVSQFTHWFCAMCALIRLPESSVLNAFFSPKRQLNTTFSSNVYFKPLRFVNDPLYMLCITKFSVVSNPKGKHGDCNSSKRSGLDWFALAFGPNESHVPW